MAMRFCRKVLYICCLYACLNNAFVGARAEKNKKLTIQIDRSLFYQNLYNTISKGYVCLIICVWYKYPTLLSLVGIICKRNVSLELIYEDTKHIYKLPKIEKEAVARYFSLKLTKKSCPKKIGPIDLILEIKPAAWKRWKYYVSEPEELNLILRIHDTDKPVHGRILYKNAEHRLQVKKKKVLFNIQDMTNQKGLMAVDIIGCDRFILFGNQLCFLESAVLFDLDLLFKGHEACAIDQPCEKFPEVDKEYACQICTKEIFNAGCFKNYDKISCLQCGQIICDTCQAKLSKCPYCREPYRSRRCAYAPIVLEMDPTIGCENVFTKENLFHYCRLCLRNRLCVVCNKLQQGVCPTCKGL